MNKEFAVVVSVHPRAYVNVSFGVDSEVIGVYLPHPEGAVFTMTRSAADRWVASGRFKIVESCTVDLKGITNKEDQMVALQRILQRCLQRAEI